MKIKRSQGGKWSLSTDTDKAQILKNIFNFYIIWGYQTMYSLEDDKSQKYICDLHKFRFYAFMVTISL